MVRLAKHRQPKPKLQLWQHKANILAHLEHVRSWLVDAKVEAIDAWQTYKSK